MIIDAWAQHPTLRHWSDPMFESLRRWTRMPVPTQELPVSATVAAMDAAGVDTALISAWVAPRQVMISNDEVAGFVAVNRAQVDAFHRAALAAGGRDNGAPGLRPQYHPHYYGAFVIGPDGHNVEAVCHKPEA